MIILVSMRDLAKASNSPIRRKSQYFNMKKVKLLGGVVLLIAAAIFVSTIVFGGSSPIGGNSSIILQEAPTGLKPVSLTGIADAAAGGVALTTQSASFRDVKFGGGASATATRSFGGGIYVLSVSATLPDPKNTYYEVWLVGTNGPVPIDFMTGSKTSWSLSLRDSDKYSSYSGIWITLERTKDTLPEEHILEGSF